MKVICILSCRYSGSTILDYMLGSHSQAFSLTELRSFIVGGRKPFTCKSCLPPESCSIYSPAFTQKLMQIGATSQLYTEIAQKSGANILIDSSKNMGWFRKTLRGLNPQDVLFVHISKSPEAYGGSERNKSHPNALHSVESIGNTWWRQNANILRFLRFSPYTAISVRYRDLIHSPQEVLNSILAYVGAQYQPGIENFWNYPHHPLWGNKGTRSHLSATDSNPTAWADESDENKQLYLENHQKLFLDEKWRRSFTDQELNSLYTVGRVSQIARLLGYENPAGHANAADSGKPLLCEIKLTENLLQEFAFEALDFPNWYVVEYLRDFYRRNIPKEQR